MSDDYVEKHMKIELNSDDELPIYWKSISISQNFFWWKNNKDFIGYLYNDDKVKPLNIMLPKTSAYVNSYMDKQNGCIVLLKMMIYWKV